MTAARTCPRCTALLPPDAHHSRKYCEHYRETVKRDQELRGLELVAMEVLP